jgi:flagellin
MAQADFTRIATNIGALNALHSLRSINNKLGVHQERLSTGKRINSAADDPAGLTIATKMLARSEGLKVALDNIGDAKNMLSVAESGLGKMTDILVQMRSKAEQAASDTLGATERAAIQSQLSSYAEQIDDIVAETKWNGVQLLDGTVDKRFQTGADKGEYTTWELSTAHTAENLGVADANAFAIATLNGTADDSFVSVTAGAAVPAFEGLTDLAAGSYSFEVLDHAASDSVGKVNVNGSLADDVSGVVASAATAELNSGASGTYTITIDEVDAATIDYTITDADGAEVASVDGFDASGDSLVLTDGGDTVGVTINLAATGVVDDMAGDTMQFEYIAAGDVKIELNDASDQAVQISADGSTSATSSFAYVGVDSESGGAVTTFNTGRGVKIGLDTINEVAAGHVANFSYSPQGDYVVDVSTALKAADYMETATLALDTVNNSLSDLGSLMARLSFKEEATSVSQVNVEASYNRIMNADMAYEQLEATKLSILQQTATTMLAQANVAPQAILGLFQ